MNIKYNCQKFDPKKLNSHNINRMAIEEILSNSLVLDIGCATGFIGEYLKNKLNCKVFGIEEREDEIKIARKKLNGVLHANVEDKEIVNKIFELTHKEKFDVILLTSLLEHLKNPDLLLESLKKVLKDNGIMVATVPNIAHWSTRFSLLLGNFDYSDYGILDNTHLRFFTIKSFKNLFKKNGFEINNLKIDAEGGGFPRISLFLSHFFPNFFAYQVLITAKIKK